MLYLPTLTSSAVIVHLLCWRIHPSIMYMYIAVSSTYLVFEKSTFQTHLFFVRYSPTIFRPTRITSYTATLIDNCFTNNYEHSADSGILITDISDHLPIFHISDLKARSHVSPNKYYISRLIDKENIDKFKVNLGSLIWQTDYEYCL
jgi:hypothetical protein